MTIGSTYDYLALAAKPLAPTITSHCEVAFRAR